MNLIDAEVTKVLCEPTHVYREYSDWTADYWYVDVEYIDMGGTGETRIMENTKEKLLARDVKVGSVFQH